MTTQDKPVVGKEPVAWRYEWKQPMTNAVWQAGVALMDPSAAKTIRNVAPLYTLTEAEISRLSGADTAGMVKRWHVGTMNDGLFIIDMPPRPSSDDVWHDRPDGPTLVVPVHGLTVKQAWSICDAHNAALSPRLSQLVSEDGWQDISTAPKDGTEITGVFVSDYGYQVKPTIYGPWTISFRDGKWMASWDGSLVIGSSTDFGTEYKEPDLEPTHWQPLPAPPILSNPEQPR